MSRFARRVDGNHTELIDALEGMGVAVLDMSRAAEVVKPGLPDVLCSLQGHTFFVEFKTVDGKLGPEQETFFRDWKGMLYLARTVDDCIAIVASIRGLNAGKRFAT